MPNSIDDLTHNGQTIPDLFELVARCENRARNILCFACQELALAGELRSCLDCGEKFCPACRNSISEVKEQHSFQ